MPSFKKSLIVKQFQANYLKLIFAPVKNALHLFKLNLDFFIGCKSNEISLSSVARPS